MTDAELDVLFARRFAYQKAYAATNMRAIVGMAHQHEIPLASHDHTTEENVVDRVSVAEFPTTIEARPRGPAGHPVVGLHPLEPIDGSAAASARSARD